MLKGLQPTAWLWYGKGASLLSRTCGMRKIQQKTKILAALALLPLLAACASFNDQNAPKIYVIANLREYHSAKGADMAHDFETSFAAALRSCGTRTMFAKTTPQSFADAGRQAAKAYGVNGTTSLILAAQPSVDGHGAIYHATLFDVATRKIVWEATLHPKTGSKAGKYLAKALIDGLRDDGAADASCIMDVK